MTDLSQDCNIDKKLEREIQQKITDIAKLNLSSEKLLQLVAT